MSKHTLTIALLLLSGMLFAQRGSNIKWTADGKGYYAIENNAIVEYSLPGFQRSVRVEATQLIPALSDRGRLSDSGAGSAAPLPGCTFPICSPTTCGNIVPEAADNTTHEANFDLAVFI